MTTTVTISYHPRTCGWRRDASPLSVRINSGGTDRLVTSKVHDLTFSKTAPGGHRQASCEVWLPPSQFPGLGPADRIYVYDPTTGTTAWEGYTDNPGERVGPGGMGFALSANGGMIRAADQAERLIYRDTSLDSWESESTGRVQRPVRNPRGGAVPRRRGHPRREARAVPAVPARAADRHVATSALSYRGFVGAGNSFGGVTGFRDGGMTSPDYMVGLFVYPPLDNRPWRRRPERPVRHRRHRLAQPALARRLRLRPVPVRHDLHPVRHRLQRMGGATNVSSDNVWAALGDVAVLGGLRDRFGNRSAHPGSTTCSPPRWSRICWGGCSRTPSTQPPRSSTPTTYHIDSLAFMDAATATNVIEELLKFEPDFDWGIGASTLSGKHSFWFRQWPTQPRYILTDDDGLDLPGSEDTLCNRVAVEWTDEKGKAQVEVVTADVPELGTRIKDADKVTLPEGRGSLANAQRIGAAGARREERRPGRRHRDGGPAADGPRHRAEGHAVEPRARLRGPAADQGCRRAGHGDVVLRQRRVREPHPRQPGARRGRPDHGARPVSGVAAFLGPGVSIHEESFTDLTDVPVKRIAFLPDGRLGGHFDGDLPLETRLR
jgi:hypothetical protein